MFSEKGQLKELKGFEIKRRGELKLIKIFQEQVFSKFLDGRTLQECYESVGSAANHWLDVCENQGQDLEDEDVFELISENKNMSEALAEYGDRKSTSIQTARRLGEFLGDEMVRDKGLNCKFIITLKPLGAPTSERAVPVAIFAAEPAIMKAYLRKWLKDSQLSDFNVRNLLDWGYYIGRLKSAIQKIITIPAALQKIPNPVPRVVHPDWLNKKLKERDDTHKQSRLDSYFSSSSNAGGGAATAADMEDIASSQNRVGAGTTFTDPLARKFAKVKRPAPAAALLPESKEEEEEQQEEEEKKEHDADEAGKKRSKVRPSTGGDGAVAGTGLLPSAAGEDSDSGSSHGSLGGPRRRRRAVITLDGDEEPAAADADEQEEEEDGTDGPGVQPLLGDEQPSSLADKALDLTILSSHQLGTSSPMKARKTNAAAANKSKSTALAGRFDAPASSSSSTSVVEAEPSEVDDFAGWIRYHSNKWSKLRSARRAERASTARLTGKAGGGEGSGGTSEHVKLGRDGLTGFLKKSALQARASYWQVVQLVEEAPGTFRLWVLLDSGALASRIVTVPRVVYVNARHPMRELEASGSASKVVRTLPRGRPCLHLYEYNMSESEWRENEKTFHTSLSSRSEIEGVYETQVPLQFKIIMEIGCVCKLDTRNTKEKSESHTHTHTSHNHTHRRGLAQVARSSTHVFSRCVCFCLLLSLCSTNEYSLPQLLYKTTAECPYLSSPSQPLRRLFLFHSFSDSRGVFGLFNADKREIVVIAVNPYRGELEKFNMRNMLKSCVEAAREAAGASGAGPIPFHDGSETGPSTSHASVALPSADATFKTHTVKDFDAGFALLGTLLRSYKESTSSPTILVAQAGGHSVPYLYSMLPSLRENFPVVTVQPHMGDNVYPALNWYSSAVKRMTERYVAHPQWWNEQLHFCRYAHVPIGNIESDYPAFISDLFFARALKHSGHLLWMSNGPRPDLGGLEEDENYFADEHVGTKTTTTRAARSPLNLQHSQLAESDMPS